PLPRAPTPHADVRNIHRALSAAHPPAPHALPPSFPPPRSSDLARAVRDPRRAGDHQDARRRGGRSPAARARGQGAIDLRVAARLDRKSRRLNSSHVSISYAVVFLKKKNYRVTLYRLGCVMLLRQ